MSQKLWNRLDNEAAELWTRPRAEVRERLIVHYMPFAEQLATKRASKNRKVDPDDVTSHCYLALVSAVDAFDPNNANGASFTTFAGWRMRGQAVEAERDNDWVSHKVRAEQGDSLPRMQRFPDESDGKRHRCENLVPEREPGDEPIGDLAAELDKWSAVKIPGRFGLEVSVREVVDLLLDCSWNVSECVRRAQLRDTVISGNAISEALLFSCVNDADAVSVIREALAAVGVEATICHFGVYQPPTEEKAVEERMTAMKRLSKAVEVTARHNQLLLDMGDPEFCGRRAA